MAAIQILLILACVALRPSSGVEAWADTEAEAEAEAAGVAEIQRALNALGAALRDSQEPLTHRLQAAQASLAPVLAALEAHTATVLLHTRSRLDRLQPALQEKLEAARDFLARTQQELMEGAREQGAAALAAAAAAVGRARDLLANPGPAGPGSEAPETPHADN